MPEGKWLWTMASHTASIDSSAQVFFRRFCRRIVGLYVIPLEIRSASMAVDGSTAITWNVTCVIARGCVPRVGVSDRKAHFPICDCRVIV